MTTTDNTTTTANEANDSAMQELETLFPTPDIVRIRDKSYTVKKITVSQMANANKLAQAAFAAVNLDQELTDLSTMIIITDAISALLDDGDLQRRLGVLLEATTGVDSVLFTQLEIEELVSLIIAVVKVNKSFFVMRLPERLANLTRLAHLI